MAARLCRVCELRHTWLLAVCCAACRCCLFPSFYFFSSRRRPPFLTVFSLLFPLPQVYRAQLSDPDGVEAPREVIVKKATEFGEAEVRVHFLSLRGHAVLRLIVKKATVFGEAEVRRGHLYCGFCFAQ